MSDKERDELAVIIELGYDVSESECPYDHAPEIAERILSVGYRKPRTITEYYGDDGLESLPYRSAILSAGDVSIAQSDGTWLDSYGSTYDFWEMGLPATVMWEPTA